MKFINDTLGEITGSDYQVFNGKITVKIQYKSRPKGFLLCVSDVFSDLIPVKDQRLMRQLNECTDKSGRKISFIYQEKEYQFFYIDEDKIRTRGSELTLPGNVKSPARIDIFWIDDQKNAHMEQEAVSKLIIPVSIAVKLVRRQKGIFKKSFFCDICIRCLAIPKLTEPILCYRVNRKEDVFYPIPEQLTKDGIITLKTAEEYTDITVEVFEKYRKFYRLQ